LLVLCPWLAACQEKPMKEEMTSLTVYGYNHRDSGIYFTLKGGGSGRAAANGQSGGSCCHAMPLRWRPGIEVEVEWSPDLKQWNKRVVEVPEYDGMEATSLRIHFLRDGEIKALVTRYELGHPNYPLQGKEAELVPGKTPGAPWWRDPPPVDDVEDK